MKQEKEFTVIGRAMATVAGFDRVYRILEQQVVLRGQAKSTFENYIHRIAQVSLHFNRLPQEVSTEELNEFLASLAVSAVSPSRSVFKHAVYDSLRKNLICSFKYSPPCTRKISNMQFSAKHFWFLRSLTVGGIYRTFAGQCPAGSKLLSQIHASGGY